MEALRTFLQQTPSKGIQEYFDQRNVTYPSDMPWDDFLALNLRTLNVVEALPVPRQVELDEECQRINQMSCPGGQAALDAVVTNWLTFSSLEDQYDRSRWAFLNEPGSFLQAESVFHFNQDRGRSLRWNRFSSKVCISEATVKSRIDAFNQSIPTELRGGEHSHTDVFSHHNDNTKIQLDIYQERLPVSEQAFCSQGDLVRRQRKPVFEFIILYDSQSGQFEITAGKSGDRQKLAELFAREILKCNEYEDITRCEYDLSSLVQFRDFQLGDGMLEVKVVELGLLFPSIDFSTTVKPTGGRYTATEIYDRIRELFGADNPFMPEVKIHHARIRVSFNRSHRHPNGKAFTFKISQTSCELKVGADHPEQTLVRAQYLQLWGLERETPSWLLD